MVAQRDDEFTSISCEGGSLPRREGAVVALVQHDEVLTEVFVHLTKAKSIEMGIPIPPWTKGAAAVILISGQREHSPKHERGPRGAIDNHEARRVKSALIAMLGWDCLNQVSEPA
jgi:hypothetical protein